MELLFYFVTVSFKKNMPKGKYCLSPNFTFIPSNDLMLANNPEATGLRNKKTGEVLVLNPFIASFLKIFETPALLQKAVDFFVVEIQESVKTVKPVIKDFFDSMTQKGVLVKENEVAKILNKPIMPNGEGQKMGDYLLKKRLGFAPPIDVYLAEKLEKLYVVKRINFTPNCPSKFIKKDQKIFSHEFKILKILRGCSGICPLIKFYPKEDFAVVEYFAGISLEKKIESTETKFSLIEKIKIFKKVLETMAFMHEKGVLHGDLHHGNILINEDLDVKIIDFDLALHVSERKNDKILRGGVKEFIPPERIDLSVFEVVNNPPDFKSEVFQIGIIAYFIFFEKLPFQGNTWHDLARSILKEKAIFENPNVPLFITKIIKKALNKRRGKRFNSATQMHSKFERLKDRLR